MVRSTTLLFIPRSTSVQVLEEKLGQSDLRQNVHAGTYRRRDVAPTRAPARVPGRARPRCPSLGPSPEVAPSQDHAIPRLHAFPSRTRTEAPESLLVRPLPPGARRYISGGQPSRRAFVPPPPRLVPQPAALPTRPESSAGAIGGRRGEPRAWPAALPNWGTLHLFWHLLELANLLTFSTEPPPHRSARHRGRRHPVPPRELANAIPAPFPASNRHVVSSWSPPCPFPGHPRRRLAGFWPEPPPAAPEDPIASSPFFPGSWVQSRDPLVRNLKLSGAWSQKWISNSICVLLIPVKSIENCKKNQKNANPIFMDSWWKVLQLLLFIPELFSNIFDMKNRNVRNLDLLYLKIHECSISNFSICCVLGYD
jgi:hypothetical protein